MRFMPMVAGEHADEMSRRTAPAAALRRFDKLRAVPSVIEGRLLLAMD
jgi:hypothetical protein